MESKTFTYQSRLKVDSIGYTILQDWAELFGKVQRTLFADLMKCEEMNFLKRSYLQEYGLTARQFNAIRVSLQGKIEAAKQSRARHVADLKAKVPLLEKKLSKIKDKHKQHQKRRSLIAIKTRLEHLQKKQQEEKVSVCFGTRKLFHAQFALAENGFSSFEEWQSKWREERNSEIFLLGSKDETTGNQSCVITQQEDNRWSLRLRLPNILAKNHGKYLLLSDLTFPYGDKEIKQALLLKTALNYRFQKDEKGWRIFISFAHEKTKVVTDLKLGAIGIDINVNHIALAETDSKGNPIHKETIPLNTYGKTKDQAKAIIGDAISKITSFALRKQKPLVVEKLDFTAKKRSFATPKQARMLSRFSYSHILESFKAKSFRLGVEIFSVNPAMTSIIGKFKFAKRYGFGNHHAAALCIARRKSQFSEAPSKSVMTVTYNNVHVTFSPPVRKREEHVWTFWKRADKEMKAALAAHFRIRKRSPCPQ